MYFIPLRSQAGPDEILETDLRSKEKRLRRNIYKKVEYICVIFNCLIFISFLVGHLLPVVRISLHFVLIIFRVSHGSPG